jgi:hypothetical protein
MINADPVNDRDDGAEPAADHGMIERANEAHQIR